MSHSTLSNSNFSCIAFTDELNILQWNCRSLPRRLDDLKYILEDSNIYIAPLCETHVDWKSCIKFPNHEIISEDRNRKGGGVALFIAKYFKFHIVCNKNLELLCRQNNVEYIIAKVFFLILKIPLRPHLIFTLFLL